jgi:putative phage-type endonuclease
MLIKNSHETKLLTDKDLAIYKKLKTVKDVERMQQLRIYQEKLSELLKLPIIKQRTHEWYEARKTRLTASDLQDAIVDNNIKLAKKKAGIIQDNTKYATIAPLKWGTMFEPMASRCYSQERDNIIVYEFGLLVDPNSEHFGASPDGINDLGIMIEIKCPYSRKIIDNSVPHKYYMQMQGQLAVCGLKECDYIECDFATYDDIDKYVNDQNNTKNRHGIIAEYKNTKTEEYEYLYSNADLKGSDALADINQQMAAKEDKEDIIFMKLTPWRLQNMNVQRVMFDENLWKQVVPKIEAFWQKVEECKLLPVEQVVEKKKVTFIDDD